MLQTSIALVVGTRPEAIKLGPVARALAAQGERPLIIFTGQHPGLDLAHHGMSSFATVPLHCAGLTDPMAHADMVRTSMVGILRRRPLRLIMVQGDTSSALGGALAAAEAGIALAHVEAGLRTHDPALPWPEEENRVRIDALSDLLFAPTAANAANCRRERVRGQIHVTGNTGIDALAAIAGSLPPKQKRRWFRRRSIDLLVTCHRRENWGAGLDSLGAALLTLAGDPGLRIDVVLHPNPVVANAMWRMLGQSPSIRLLPPQSHDQMIDRLQRADLVLSDSGGIQEEAPALGVPLLILRDKTERPESIQCGSAELVGIEAGRIVSAVRRLVADRDALDRMSTPAMPFGDGRSAPRIAALAIAFVEDLVADCDAEMRRA